jgi:PASTA domain-containing protein
VVRLGSWDGPLYGVRLRATVCARSSEELYPDFVIAHFLVAGPRRKWWLVRKVLDRPPWLVPLQEGWNGKKCGSLVLKDPIPPEHVGGVEQLGNPWSCYGVGLTIKAGGRRASKRVLVQCGGVGSRTSCRPGQQARPPWVVGQARRRAVNRLRDAGFRAMVFRQNEPNARVPAGIIVEQEPSRGLRLCKGSDVTLTVSIGKR